MAAFNLFAIDKQWRKPLFAQVLNVGSEIAQGVDKNADGALLHAFSACDGVCAGRAGEVGRQEPHGRTGCFDVDFGRHVA